MDYSVVVARLTGQADKDDVLTKMEADARYNEKVKNISFSVYNYSNNTLTIPNNPISRMGFVLYLNGVKQDESRFSVSGNIVNLNFMPNGDIITVAYWVDNKKYEVLNNNSINGYQFDLNRSIEAVFLSIYFRYSGSGDKSQLFEGRTDRFKGVTDKAVWR